MKLARNIIIALILGVIVGLLLNIFAKDAFTVVDKYLFDPVGQIFIRLIKMLVVPIVFFSIVLGTAGISDPKKLGRIGIKTIVYFLSTTTIAIVIAISLAYVFQPGESADLGVNVGEYEPDKAPDVVETLLNIIPTNPVQAMTEGNMLQIIAFSVFVGFALATLKDKTKGLTRLIEQGNDVMMYLVNIIMYVAPLGAFGLIASAVGNQGLDAIQAMAMYMFVVVLTLLIHAVFVYGSAVYFLGKYNPIEFFKGFSPAMVVAFSTASSSGTLPVSMKTAQDNLKIPKQVSSFVQPLGATINMDGTAIMQGVATVFIAQVYNVNLGLPEILIVVLTAVLASIGTAGVPGVGLIMLALVLESVGLPVSGIALIIGVDRILDMLRTSVNITGDASCALIVSKSEEKNNPEETPA